MGTGKEIIYSRVCLLILSCNSEVQENNTDIQKAKRTQKNPHSSRNSVVVCFVVFLGGGGDGGAFCFFFLPQWF